jgi:hypothetical protein
MLSIGSVLPIRLNYPRGLQTLRRPRPILPSVSFMTMRLKGVFG